MNTDLYFYMGKFRTEEGLKRALIKEGVISHAWRVRAYEYSDMYYDYKYLKDMLRDSGLEEKYLKHFRKWLKDNNIPFVGKQTWYYSDAMDGWNTLDNTMEAVLDGYEPFDPKFPEYFVEPLEYTLDNYTETLSHEEYQLFVKLPEEKQFKQAMKWRINSYKEMYNI